jgi:ABC-type transport system involved in multi-copper enzyme maturation permease subunit
MISKPLLKQTIKSNWGLWAVATASVCILLTIIKVASGSVTIDSAPSDQTALVPYIQALMSQELTLEGLFTTIGINPDLLTNIASMNINDVINEIFYSLVAVLLPLVYVIVTGNKLFASQVDKGSMAYVLSTPTKRTTVSFTQMFFMIGSLFSMFTVTSVVDIIVTQILDGKIDLSTILLMNCGLFLFTLAMGGLCFMFSSIFNYSKYSLTFGGGLGLLFFLCKILGLFGSDIFMQAGIGIESMNTFNYLTMISLFDTGSIAAGTSDYLWKFGILCGVAVISFAIGTRSFAKKDLPL